MFKLPKRILFFTLAFIGLSGCDILRDGNENSVDAITVHDLAADPQVITDPTQAPKVTGKFTLFSLKDNKIIANADSATTKWDLGFRASTIIFNGGTNGPGTTAAQVISGDFDLLTLAPETGYVMDDKTNVTRPYAVPVGSGNGWYNYNPASMILSPIPGKLILVRTSTNKYAKIQILNYYKGAPSAPDASAHQSRYYQFRYVYQSDGTRTFPSS